MAKRTSVTSVEQSPEDARKRRFINYTVAMLIRVACILLAVVVTGWLQWVFFAGAILLPYFAVVVANATGSSNKAPKAQAVTPLQISSKDFIDASER